MTLKDLNEAVRSFLEENYPTAEHATVVIERENGLVPPTQLVIPWKPKAVQEKREAKSKEKAKKAAV